MGKASITIAVSSVFNGTGFDKAIQSATKFGSSLSRVEKLTAASSNSMAQGIGQVGLKWEETGRKLEDFGKKTAELGDNMTKSITLPMVAAGAYAGKMAVDFDTALANVRKTSDLTEEQLESLAQSALELSKTQPVDAQTILNVEALGAQLGVSNERLEDFAKTVTGLDIATNMNAEQAGTELARFANIVGMTEDKFSNYGSTLVAIGNNMATTESEVSQMAMRFASAGSQAGLTEAQILGMSAAMSSLGIKAEMGGSALSQVFVNISKAVANGGESLEAFASRSNMSAEEFASAWNDDAAGAFNSLIEGIGKASAAGEDMNVIMSELGITQIRQSDVMRRLAGSTEAVTGKQSVLASALKLSTDAWNENTALQKEVDQRNESMASRLDVLKNKIDAVAITVGRPLVDAVIDVLDAMDPLIQTVSDAAQAFADMDEEGQRNILMWAGVAAAAGPVLSVTGRITQGAGHLVRAFGETASKVAVYTDALNTLDGANLRTYGSSKSHAAALGLAKNAAVQAAGGVDNYVKAWDAMVTSAGRAEAAQSEINSLLARARVETGASKDSILEHAYALSRQRDEAVESYKANAKLVTSFGNSTQEAEKAAKGAKSLESALGEVVDGASAGSRALDSTNGKLSETAAKSASAAKGASGFGLALKSVALQLPGIMLAGTVALSVAALGAAFLKCEESARKAEERQRAFTDAAVTFSQVSANVSAAAEGQSFAYDKVTESARAALEGISEMNGKASETMTEFEVSRSSLEQYVSTIEQLGAKGKLTAVEQGRLQIAVDGYNKVTGDSVSITDAAAGALSKSTDEILVNARAWEENARKQALQSVAQGYIEKQVQAEIALNSSTEAYNRALADRDSLQSSINAKRAAGITVTTEELGALEKSIEAVKGTRDAMNEASAAYDSATKSVLEATSMYALEHSNLAQSIKDDIASQELCYQDFALAVATNLQASGQSVGTFQQNLANLGVSTDKMRQMGSDNFMRLWESCNGDVSLMIQKINEYNGTPLDDKDADVEAHGNVPSGDAKSRTDDAQASIKGLSSKSVDVNVNGNYDFARSSIWNLGSAIGGLASKTIDIVANVTGRHAAGGVVMHARGGIATRATDVTRHIAGEAGAEALVPLTNRHYVAPFAQVIAQETVSALRGSSNPVSRGGDTYNLYIDGSLLGSASPTAVEALRVFVDEVKSNYGMGAI